MRVPPSILSGTQGGWCGLVRLMQCHGCLAERPVALTPVSGKRKGRSGKDLFPLLMPEEWRGALRHFAEEASWSEAYSCGSSGGRSRNVAAWQLVGEVWSGLMLIGLNTSLSLYSCWIGPEPVGKRSAGAFES